MTDWATDMIRAVFACLVLVVVFIVVMRFLFKDTIIG